ncbi:hypothetical protein BH24DEI2_BH24DEI2_28620 [soil metagenome]
MTGAIERGFGTFAPHHERPMPLRAGHDAECALVRRGRALAVDDDLAVLLALEPGEVVVVLELFQGFDTEPLAERRVQGVVIGRGETAR